MNISKESVPKTILNVGIMTPARIQISFGLSDQLIEPLLPPD